MTSADIRDAIVGLVSDATGCPRVYGHERYVSTKTGLKALYADADGMIFGWHVRRGTVARRALASGRQMVRTTWSIVGYRSLVDAEASELALDQAVDLIAEAWRADTTLGGLVRGVAIEGAEGPQVTDTQPVMFADVLCHAVTLALVTEHVDGAADSSDVLAGLAPEAAGLVREITTRLSGVAGLAAAEGRPAWDVDDDPVALPAAIIVPRLDRVAGDATTLSWRERVDAQIAVYLIAPSGHLPDHGARAADGMTDLRARVRAALHGWQPETAAVELPLWAAGGDQIPAPPGRVIWRDLFTATAWQEASD